MRGLPSEIVQQILHEFVSKLATESQIGITFHPYLRKSSYTELIKLRLVSRTFSRIVISLYFETISIQSLKHADVILTNWNTGLGRVRRLRIEKLWYNKDKDCGKSRTVSFARLKRVCPKAQLDRFFAFEFLDEGQPNAVSMVQFVKLIKLLGGKLETLDITFCHCMGLTDYEDFVGSLQGLKSLRLSHSYGDMRLGTYEPYSLLASIADLPKLQCLSLDCDDTLEHFEDYWGPEDVFSISHVSLAPDEEQEANCHIIQLFKKTLKVVELPYTPDSWIGDGIQEFLEPVKDTLEGFFTTEVTKKLMERVANWDFRNLRVVGFQSSSYPNENDVGSDVSWLQVPMMKNVRTIVTDLRSSGRSWDIRMDGLKKGPSLKVIVFNKQNLHEEDICPELVEDFNSRGVHCHVIHAATAQEIMELDYRLNGDL